MYGVAPLGALILARSSDPLCLRCASLDGSLADGTRVKAVEIVVLQRVLPNDPVLRLVVEQLVEQRADQGSSVSLYDPLSMTLRPRAVLP